jgi:hypothetical protein
MDEKILNYFLNNASPAQIIDFQKKKTITQKYKYLLQFDWINQDQYLKYTRKKNENKTLLRSV